MPLVEVEGKLPAASVREKAKEKAEPRTRIASRLSLVGGSNEIVVRWPNTVWNKFIK